MDLDELLKRKHPDNSKLHDQALLEEMIADNGFVSPPLLDERTGLLAFGHGRLDQLAAMKAASAPVPEGVEDLDGAWMVPVILGVSFASDEALLKYLVGDNRAVERGGWDNKKLVEALSRIGKENLRATGFDQSELVTFLARMRSTERKADPDAEAPTPPKKAVAKRGQVWQLGDHRLLCGDSTVEADVKKLMGDERALLMATDPPYGVDYVNVAAERGQPRSQRKWNVSIEGDEKTGAEIQPFLEAAFRAAAANALIEKAAWYMWHAQMTQGFFAAAAAAAAAVQIHRQIIWVKPSLLLGHGDYHWRHELCFYGWVKGHRPPFYGQRNQTTVWEMGNETAPAKRDHPTQKPVRLFEIPMENHTKGGEVCYEPFSGSGSQIIAGEKLGRRVFAMEIDPRYVDVAVQRFEEYSGKKARKLAG